MITLYGGAAHCRENAELVFSLNAFGDNIKMQRVSEASDIVIPAHDFRIPMRIPEDWWAIPDSTDGDLSHHPVEA